MEHFTKQQRGRLGLLTALLMIAFTLGFILNPLLRNYSDNTGILRIGVFSDSLWGESNGYSHVILNQAIAAFEKNNPGVKVVYESGIRRQDYSEWLSEGILKGTAPDLFFVLDEDFEYLADVGALQNLETFTDGDPAFDPDVYYEAALMAGKRGQILYGLPLECSPTIMVVNTSILEKEKIEMPAMDWTWYDCYRICRQVTGRRENSSGYQFGISEYDWENCFYSNDVVLFSEDGSTCYLTDEKAGEAISFLDKLGRLAAKATNVQPSFSDGNVLFQPMSYSAYKAYISNPIHMGVGDDFNSLLQTQLIAMNSQSSKKELAWELMKTMTADPEVQKEIYRYSEGISVLRDVTSADDAAAEQRRDKDTEVLRIAMEKAVNRQRFRGKEEAGQQIGLAVDSILAGSGNIRMEQIIYNRRINRYLQQ